MKRMMLAVWLLVGLVLAQLEPPDDLLTRYEAALASLERSVATLPADGAQSLEALERANTLFIGLAGETASDTLIRGMEATFEQARTAIGRRSPTDLAVQTTVIAGGFKRIVYESAVRAALAGDLALAQSRLAHLASDLGLPQAQRQALLQETALPALQAHFEIGTAARVMEHLASARAQAGTSVAEAYLALARAYSAYIPIQDSARLAEAAGPRLVSAINALVAGDLTAMNEQLAQVEQQFLALSRAATALLPAPAAPVPAEVAPPPAEAAPLPQPPVVAPEPPTVEALPDLPTQPGEQERAEALAELERTLARFGLSPTERSRLAASYLESGLANPEAAIERLWAQSARIAVAAQNGEITAARQALSVALLDYRRYLQPLVSSRDEGLNHRTLELFRSLTASPALRLQDTATLTQQIDHLATALGGGTPPLTERLSAVTTSYWAGWPRLVVIILLGMLAFIPLRLLNLAFGGGNRNWQLVGVALFLLLLPIIFESVTFLGSLLASLFKLESLNALASYSIFQSELAQLVWVLVTASAIALAIIGLRGICVQFGLLGQRTKMTTSQTRRTTKSKPDSTVDWDEEF
ncbi:MAG: hypothetical protein KGZ35_06095 [Truepera sp.]|nr:hypothetical protein [Truepera sp.]